MKTVFLCAGNGKRMIPLTDNLSKSMLPVSNKPLLQVNIEKLSESGLKDFIIVINPNDSSIKEYFQDGHKYKVNIEYVYQKESRGTGDALKTLEDVLDEKNFLTSNGDILVKSSDIKKILKIENSLGVFPVKNPQEYGVIELKNNKLFCIKEKEKFSSSNLINSGIYHFNRDIFKFISKTEKSHRGEYELTDAINLLAKEQDIVPIFLKEWQQASYPWDLLDINKNILDSYSSSNNVFIGKSTNILRGVIIEGPVIIGNNCKIGPNCYIRPYSSIGNNCRIGNSCEVKNSIIMENTKIPHHNYVGDSIISKNCNLGAGTKLANVRLDQKNIFVNGIDTCRKKLGAIVGENVQTGINSNIMPGKLIGSNSYIGSGVTLFQNMEKNQYVKLINPSNKIDYK